jgi:predicted enzyme related to lactoylglutathione lyase
VRNAIGWFEIYVDDMARAKAFYEAVFGVTLTRLEAGGGGPQEMWSFPMDDQGYGAPGALVKMQGFAAGANSVLVYFHCADCAVEAGRAKQAGGRVERDKFAIGQYGHIALVVDTEGNMIGLHSTH